ncbi:unnamed protein product, partial [Cyprideis torosa]
MRHCSLLAGSCMRRSIGGVCACMRNNLSSISVFGSTTTPPADPPPLTPKGLYKHLLRQIKKLPEAAQPYYKNHVRQGFLQHSDETDPERVAEIVSQAIKNGEWVVQKNS